LAVRLVIWCTLCIDEAAHLPMDRRCLGQGTSLKCYPSFHEDWNHYWTAK